MELEICIHCKNRIEVHHSYIEDENKIDEMYWYCLYDQTKEDDCQYYEDKNTD